MTADYDVIRIPTELAGEIESAARTQDCDDDDFNAAGILMLEYAVAADVDWAALLAASRIPGDRRPEREADDE